MMLGQSSNHKPSRDTRSNLMSPTVTKDRWSRLSHRVSFFLKTCFSSPLSSLASLILGFAVVVSILRIADWAIVNAAFVGNSSEDCLLKGGACWVFVKDNFQFFIYGMLDETQRWRADLFLALITLATLLLLSQKTRRLGVIVNWLVMPIVTLFLAYVPTSSGNVDTDTYGGLFLTMMMSYFAIIWSLPFGIILALGRRSKLPVIRFFSVLWIELWRGVPLITVLFMSSVMLPVFLPPGVEISKLSRAMIGVVAFSTAYMAEVVRGGLQGVPSGHAEACHALGLSWFQSMRFVILPQALRIVTPGILNNFVSLFKDTSLVAIIGMFDFLGAVQAATKNSAWVGYSTEAYVFSAMVFWIFCFGISRFASHLGQQSPNPRS